MNDDKKIIGELLGSDFGKAVIKELGMEGVSQAAQADFIDTLGHSAMERVTLEILKILPQEEYETFDTFIHGEDMLGFRAFLSKYIPNLDEFIQEAAQREFETIKTHMRMAEQGIE